MKTTTWTNLLIMTTYAGSLCAPLIAEPAKNVDKIQKDTSEKSSREPTLKLPEALQIATTYLAAERIDLSGHFLESVALTEAEGKVGRNWRLTWIPSAHVVGGEIWVYVSMDRRLNPIIERGK